MTEDKKIIVFVKDGKSAFVENLKKEGNKVTVATTNPEGNGIEVMKAMKKVAKKEQYQILADEDSGNYLEVAKKLGYNEYRKEVPSRADHSPRPPEAPKTPGVTEEMMMSINEWYKFKLEGESKKLAENYKNKEANLEKAHQERLQALREESESINQIKLALRKSIYGVEDTE